MTVDKADWQDAFSIEKFNTLVCPSCSIGQLKVITITEKQTSSSYNPIDRDIEPDPMDYEGRFNAILTCDKCKDNTYVLGRSTYLSYEDDYGVEQFEMVYTPVCFYPAPNLITLDFYVPTEIQEELKKAFFLFWQDYSAAGNRLRVAIEKILDKFNIPRITHLKKRMIPLHKRIELFKERVPKHAHISEQLMAVKWLGNEASHTTNLTRDVIFDELKLLEYILEELFKNKKDEIQLLTKKINKRKGSIHSKKVITK